MDATFLDAKEGDLDTLYLMCGELSCGLRGNICTILERNYQWRGATFGQLHSLPSVQKNRSIGADDANAV